MAKYTVKEYAEKFGLATKDVSKACREGDLVAEKVSGKWVITVEDTDTTVEYSTVDTTEDVEALLGSDTDSCTSEEDTCDCTTDTHVDSEADCEYVPEDSTCDCNDCCCEDDCSCCEDTDESDTQAPVFNPLENVSMDDILDKVADYILTEDLSDLDKFETDDDTVVNITANSVMLVTHVFKRILHSLVEMGQVKEKHIKKCMERLVDTYQARVDTFGRYKKKVRKFIKKFSFDLTEPTQSLEYFLYNFLFTNDSVVNKVVYEELILPALKKDETKDNTKECSEEMTESLEEE